MMRAKSNNIKVNSNIRETTYSYLKRSYAEIIKQRFFHKLEQTGYMFKGVGTAEASNHIFYCVYILVTSAEH